MSGYIIMCSTTTVAIEADIHTLEGRCSNFEHRMYVCITLYCQTKTNFFVGKLADVGCLGWPEFLSPIFTALLGLI